MHIKSLKVFCDVVRRRSFSRAADENGISQSGASQIVHQLEESLGVKLIDRSKRPFILTPEGDVYYGGCRKLVQRFFALEDEVRTLHLEVAGRVGVASIYSVGLSHLNHYVQEFLSQHPKANVRLEYHHPDRVYQLIENDQADLGLVSYPKSSRNIKAISWREEPMWLVCAPSNALASRDQIYVKELAGRKLVSFDPELRIRREIDRALSNHGVDVEVVMEFDNIETIKRAIEIDAGVGILPAPTVERELQMGSLAALTFRDLHLVRPLGIIRRRGHEFGKTASRFLKLLKDKSDAFGSAAVHAASKGDRKSIDDRDAPRLIDLSDSPPISAHAVEEALG